LERARETYVDNALDLAEHGSDGLTDEGNGGEQSGFADQDVEEGLVDTDKLSVRLAMLVKHK
jgi:hypothetical protein